MAGDLLLHHARVTGPGAAREPLAAALGAVMMPSLADDELLYIPRHRSRAILRPNSGSFAIVVSAELSQAMASALIDPPPGATANAYRFTSRAAFAAWVIGTWLASLHGSTAASVFFAFLPGGTPMAWARCEFFDNGRILPATFAALARQGQAAQLLARLDSADLVRMRRALLHSHWLPLPERLAEVWPFEVSELAGSPTPARAGTGAPPEATTTVRAVASTAAAAREAGNDLAALPEAAVELLLVLLHLQADPATPRAALAAAAATVAAGASVGSVPTDPAVASEPTEPTVTSVANASDAAVAGPPATNSECPSPISLPPPLAESSGVRRHRPAHSPAAPATPPQSPHSEPRADSSAAPLAGFASDFAGLLFLLNAFLAMGIYPDFTGPADAALAMAPTRLLDRLAVQWFGSRYGGDHLHKALAPFAADPPLPDRWQVEPAWLEAFASEGEATIATASRHQTLWHPAGFPLADAPLPGRKGRRKRVQRQDQSAAFRHRPQLPTAQPARWLACLALYLDARIQRATDDPALGLSSLAIPGHCRIGADRIDIDLALADLPLPLRLAGLDRDLGWLPAEGRAIAFHFQ